MFLLIFEVVSVMFEAYNHSVLFSVSVLPFCRIFTLILPLQKMFLKNIVDASEKYSCLDKIRFLKTYESFSATAMRLIVLIY